MLMGGIGVDAFNTTLRDMSLMLNGIPREEPPKVDSKEKKVGKGGKGAPKAKRRGLVGAVLRHRRTNSTRSWPKLWTSSSAQAQRSSGLPIQTCPVL